MDPTSGRTTEDKQHLLITNNNNNNNNNRHSSSSRSSITSTSTSTSSSTSSNHRLFHNHQKPTNNNNNYLQQSFSSSSFNKKIFNNLRLSSKLERIPRGIQLVATTILSVSILTIIINVWSHNQIYNFRRPWYHLPNSDSTYLPLSSNHSTSWSSISSSYTGKPVCDPFSEPGSVLFDEKSYNDANWLPYRSDCPPSPDYLSSLRNLRSVPNSLPTDQQTDSIDHPVLKDHDRSDPIFQAQSGQSRNMFDLWGRPYPSLNFLHGKTILYLGDSVDRNGLEQLWRLVGANVRSLSYDDINVEPSKEWDRRSTPWEVDLGLLHPRNRNQSLEFNKNRPNGEFAGLNCRFINGFFYGLDDIDEFSAQGDWHPPGKVEDRIKELFTPMTDQFAKESPVGEGPAFISLQSGLWDLAFFGRRNKKTNTTIDSPLTREQLDWYQNRYRSMIKALKTKYPETPIWIRKTHRVGDQFWASHDWQAGIKGGIGEGFVNFFSDVRIHQIREVQSYVATVEGLPVFDFGKLWEGYQKFQDKVHPQQIPGGILMNQAIIHHVWMESIGRKNWESKLTSSLGPLPHRILD